MSELASPGPLVAANASTSDRSILDALAALLSSRGAYTRWLRDAISGTIPPYFSCAAICDATSLASKSDAESPLRRRKIATPVSSQEVSSANIVMSSEVETSLERKFSGTQKKPRFLDLARNDKQAKAAFLFLYRLCFRRVLLRVNHDALERIDCPQHLRVSRFDDAFIVLGLHISRISQREERTLLLGRHGNTNIRRHAITLNDLFARRVVFCCCKTHRRSIRQLHDILHGTFSKGCFTDKHGPTQILQSSGNDLGSACAAFIDQHHHWKTRALLLRPGS